ncbi:hypothetical protein GL297_06495 [Komagataeibacter sp. FXV2]|nr:hypothetical protein [Komagataeibacter sp. FXV2]
MNEAKKTCLLCWLRQPTTLVGFALLVGGFVGDMFGSISEGLAGTIILSAIPLMIPDNTTAQAQASTAAGVLVHALHGVEAKSPVSKPAVTKAPNGNA